MSSLWNNRISISIFGEAQGPAIGVILDNLPPGEYIDVEELGRFLSRRNPKKKGSSRSDNSMPQILSGVLNDRTTGSPLCAFIQNTEVYSAISSNVSRLARPGHADYTGTVRYRGFNDVRDSGHLSQRLMTPLCFAGAVCAQILERRGIYTGAHISELHNIKDTPFNPTEITRQNIIDIRYKEFPVINDKKGKLMQKDILKAQESDDTLGGVIECAAINVPAGIGSPIFDGLENSIAQLIFGIPTVKGLEFGAGFNSAKMTGSVNNDEFYLDEHGHVLTRTNNHGGILGGISSGMPITLRVAVKPSPTISRPQNTVDYRNMKNDILNASEKQDSCIVPRIVPCVEAAVNIALLSNMLDYPNFC